MNEQTPLYSSRIIKTYLEYLTKNYPEINQDELLSHAVIKKHEVMDPSHFFTQEQIDRFQELLQEKTGNPTIAREVGRYTSSAQSFGTVKTHILGLLDPAVIYELVAKIMNRMARQMTMTTRRKGINRVDVLAVPRKGSAENPAQCLSRIGILEAVAQISTGDFAVVEHDRCIHQGSHHCHYSVTWSPTPALLWSRVRLASLMFAFLTGAISFFLLTFSAWTALSSILSIALLAIVLYSGHVEKTFLLKTIETQSSAASNMLEQSTIHYNNALLIQDLGQATTSLLEVPELCARVMDVMHSHVDFDRGMIMLADSSAESLTYAAGFGFSREEEDLIRHAGFPLTGKESGLLARLFHEDAPVIVHDFTKPGGIEGDKKALIEKLSFKSGICVAVMYGGKALGIMGVVNVSARRSFTQSDLNLIKGIASQLAVGITSTKAYQKMQESEQKYRTIFESTSSPSIIIEQDTTISLANSAFVELSGYGREELEGMLSWTSFIAAEDLAKMKHYHAVRRQDPKMAPRNYEFRFIDRNGSVRDIHLTVDLIPGTSQSIASLLDVTERNRAAREIEERRKYLESLFEAAPDAVIALNADRVIVEWNPGAEKLFGYSRSEVQDKCLDDVITTPETREEAYAISERLTRDTKVLPLESTCHRKDGTPVQVMIAGSPIIVHETVVGYIALYTDISEIKKAEAALRQSEERYRLLAENAHDVIWLTDPNLRYTYISPSVERLRGYTPEEAMKLSTDRVYTPESYKRAIELFMVEYEALLKKEPADRNATRTVELEQIRKDGSTVWVEVTATGLFDEKGNPIGLLGITRDISERKKAEQEKRRLQEQLLHAQKMEAVGTLAGGIAHDFNNILMGIQGNVSLVLMDMGQENEVAPRLHNVEQYVKRGSDLTRRLLGFARGGKYEVKPTDLGDLVRKSTEMFGRTHKEIAIHTMLSGDLHSVEVDRGQIDQVLLNLFVNAWQAMPDGGELYIRTENMILDESFVKPYGVDPGDFVMVSVRDTGLGIDEKIIDRIFDPFFTTKATGSNTGLGLASAYGIISNHGGFITCSSTVGKGTTFTFYLPVSSEKAQNDLEKESVTRTGAETILLVDDEDMILSVGKAILDRLGYRAMTARNGIETLKLYRRLHEEIDLVILDMVMPGMGGRETFEGIKDINPKAKVLLASGYDMHGQALQLMSRGCSGFIQKPFSVQDLSARIREILDNTDHPKTASA